MGTLGRGRSRVDRLRRWQGSRVGVLMSNRPEYLSRPASESRWLAASAVTLSTFSTPPELEHLLQAPDFDPAVRSQVLRRTSRPSWTSLEPEIRTARPARLKSLNFPFLRRLAAWWAARQGSGDRNLADFLAHGKAIPPDWSTRPQRRAAKRPRHALLLLGHDQQAQGHSQRASRHRHPVVAMAAHLRASSESTVAPGPPTDSSGPASSAWRIGPRSLPAGRWSCSRPSMPPKRWS